MAKKNLYVDENGIYHFKVTFNYREEDNGYVLGIPRNYPTKKVKALVNSPQTKKWIDNGNAVIMFGHGTRDIAKGRFVPQEHHPISGEVQVPLGKITKLSINPKNHNLIDFEGIFIPAKDNKVDTVVKLIENELGGFSFVWNVPKGIFYGADYVLVQNFSSNKVTLDAINDYCENGQCPIDTTLDSVMETLVIPPDLYSSAIDLLNNQEEIIGMKNTVRTIRDLKTTLDGKNEYIAKIEKSLEAEKRKNKKLSKKLKKKIAESQTLLDAIEEIGTIEDNKIKPTGLDKIFKPIDTPTFDSFDPQKIKTRRPHQQGQFKWTPRLANRL